MTLLFRQPSSTPVEPCPPGRERQRLTRVLAGIDKVLAKPDEVSRTPLDGLKQDAVAALESLVFGRPNEGFEDILARVNRIRLSGYFQAPFPSQQTSEEFWLSQLRELRNIVAFTLARLRRRTSKEKKKRPGSRGRPRDVHINTALRILREGKRNHKKEHRGPRALWDWVFNNEVIPHFQKDIWPQSVSGWTDNPEQVKKQIRKLRNALRNRGGDGKRPAK